jgi:hypothetical protein
MNLLANGEQPLPTTETARVRVPKCDGNEG